MTSRELILTRLEWHGPFCLFFVGVLISFPLSMPEEKIFLSVIATIGALLSTLTGVSISIFLSIKTELADKLREKGHYKQRMKYGNRSILICLSLLIIAVAGFFVPSCPGDIWYKALLFGIFFSAVGASYRIFWILTKIGGISVSSNSNEVEQ